MKSSRTTLNYFIAFIILVGTYFIGYKVLRDDFISLFSAFLMLCLGAFYFWKNNLVKEGIIIGILVRVILLFSTPSLSDDCYRYIWDGNCLLNGIHPFEYIPSELIRLNFPFLNDQLISKFNSPNYFSVYPIVLQNIFAISTFLSNGNEVVNIFWMKLIFLFFDTGAIYYSFKLLKKIGKSTRNSLIIALHPIIYLETVGNLHAEGIMLFFVIASFYFLIKRHFVLSAVLLSLSVATKLLPLLFLPIFFVYIDRKFRMKWLLAFCLSTLIMFSPLLNPDIIHNISNSLGLYYHQFEFNASFYYVLKFIQQKIWGIRAPRLVGTILLLPTIIYLASYFLRHRTTNNNKLFEPTLFVFTIYLLCSATLHPWYVILLVGISTFTNFYFPSIWAILIFSTYIHYSKYQQYEGWVIAIEYFIVIICMTIEYKNYLRLSSANNLSK